MHLHIFFVLKILWWIILPKNCSLYYITEVIYHITKATCLQRCTVAAKRVSAAGERLPYTLWRGKGGVSTDEPMTSQPFIHVIVGVFWLDGLIWQTRTLLTEVFLVILVMGLGLVPGPAQIVDKIRHIAHCTWALLHTSSRTIIVQCYERHQCFVPLLNGSIDGGSCHRAWPRV